MKPWQHVGIMIQLTVLCCTLCVISTHLASIAKSVKKQTEIMERLPPTTKLAQ